MRTAIENPTTILCSQTPKNMRFTMENQIHILIIGGKAPKNIRFTMGNQSTEILILTI